MHGLDFLQDLTLVLVVAGLAGWICQRIGLSSVVGFLLAGVLIGPHTPPFALVSDQERIQTLSQLGLVFLMFSVGMGLSIGRLRRMGGALLLATGVSAFLVFTTARSAGLMIGWSPTESLFLAAMLMVSSSAIINKVLHEIGATHDPAGRLALGITIIEDIVAVVMLTVLTSVSHAAGSESASIGSTLGLITVFVIVLVVAGLLLVPRFLKSLTRTADVDLQTILVAGLVLAVSVLTVKAGYSLALGAFLLGAVVAETAQRVQVERYLQGLRDIFTAVFFVSIGMMMDVKVIAGSWHLVLLFGVFTLVIRAVASTAGQMLIGNPTKDAVRIGLMVTPIGEFSFIIAQLGVSEKAAPELLYPLAVGVALFTAFTAPFLIKHSGAISHGIERIEPQFLKNLVEFYQRTLERMHQRQQGNLVWQLSKKRFAQIAIGFLFTTGMLAFARPIASMLMARFGDNVPMPQVWMAAFWTALGAVVMAPLFAIWRNVSALSMIYAEAISRGQRQEAIRIPLETGLKTVFAVAMAIWIWLLLPFEFHGFWTATVVVLLLGLLLVLLRHELIFLHSRVEVEIAETLAPNEGRPVRTREEWLRQHQEWNIHVHELILPDHAECAGSTLSELALRSRFGCSIAGVERHGFAIPNPPPELTLYPGDKLLLLATPEQLNRAREFISRTRPADEKSFLIEEIELEGITVPPGSSAAGKVLVELEIPAATGVQLVGIERDGHRLLNPGPFQGIEPGDRLLALGTHAQIEEFERWLQPPG